MCWHSYLDEYVELKNPQIWLGCLSCVHASHSLAIIILVVLNTLLDIIANESPSEQATSVAVNTLTAVHEGEARAAIERYYEVVGSLEADLDRGLRAQVETGPSLETALTFEYDEDDDTIYVNSDFTLDEVYVLSYTTSQMKVIGCGSIGTNVVNRNGELIESLDNFYFSTIFVFLQEDDTWKVATAFGLDRDNLIHMFPYMSEWEREAIGDAESYVWTYSGCGMDN